MNYRHVMGILLIALSASVNAEEQPAQQPLIEIENPQIDMPGFLAIADEAAEHRAQRRISEEEFIRLSREPNTIILDARSAEKYAEMHVEGAVNLSFPDITVESLQQLIPDKNTRILIYCNNNFVNAPRPFPTKRADASLNLSTFISLYSYGYRNIYELGPLMDIDQTKLSMVSGVESTPNRLDQQAKPIESVQVIEPVTNNA